MENEKKDRRDFILKQMHDDTRQTMEIRKKKADDNKAVDAKFNKCIKDIVREDIQDKYLANIVKFFIIWQNDEFLPYLDLKINEIKKADLRYLFKNLHFFNKINRGRIRRR